MKLLQIIVVFIFGMIAAKAIEETKPKVDLPEEYELITKENNLKGYFDKDSVLHIEFDNQYIVEPEYILEIDNDSVLIQSDNIIYKCHYRDIQKTIDKDNL